jgi:AcrR family transcriptional regulator
MFYSIAMHPSTKPDEDTLPSAPRRVPRRRGPRRSTLSVQAIIDAAIEAIDEGGVADLSMRAVAECLGTGAASLYFYVSGREELLELVYDELVGRVPLPEPDPERWHEQLRQMMSDLRDILTSHRDAALAGLGRIPTSAKSLRAAETIVSVMRAGGLSDRVVALGLDQLILYVSACAFEDGLKHQGGVSEADARRYFDEAHAFYRALPVERYPVLASIAEEMTGHDGDERFQFGLDLLIAGLEGQGR